VGGVPIHETSSLWRWQRIMYSSLPSRWLSIVAGTMPERETPTTASKSQAVIRVARIATSSSTFP